MTARQGVSRRGVLRGAAGGAALGAVCGVAGLGPDVAVRLAFDGAPMPDAQAADTGDVLVVLSLRGGFDGLNVVAPLGDPAYAAARPTLAVPAVRATQADTVFGLHPALAPLLPFWQAGTFGVVHAVGQPNPTRSHFAAMSELERAAPGSTLRTGWLDRMIGLGPTSSVFTATQVGSTGLLGSLAGPSPELVMSAVDDVRILAAWNDAEHARWATALGTMHRGAPAAIAAPARTALSAMATTRALRAKGNTPANGAVYPDTELGKAFRDVARLVKAGVGMRVAVLDFGDWDFHAGEGDVDAGRLHDKLTELAGSLAAFGTDLGALLAGVSVVTVTEFGRRVAENGSGGTDHGLASAMLLLGGGVVGGRVHGRWPGLAPGNLVDGDLAATTDYRQVLAEVLSARCRVGAAGLASVFPGLRRSPLGVVRAR